MSSETCTKPAAGDPVERLAKRALDPDAVDLAHREDPRLPSSRSSSCSAGVERPSAHKRHTVRVDRRQTARRRMGKLRACKPEGSCERHPVHVPRGLVRAC